jgi:hypothetical protein
MAFTWDESRLRHPAERPVFFATVFLNLVLLAVAVAVVVYGPGWLARYPRLAKRTDQLQVTAGAAILAPFALTVLRNRRRASVRANSVQLSRAQIPEIYEDFERMCATLGMQEPPELFVSEDELDQPSAAYSTWNSHFVVLDPKFLESNLDEVRDVYRFFLGRELGRIRLGHTRWLDEALITYVAHTPVLRNPLLHARTYSHDRYAAYLAPDSVRGLVVQASGRHMLKRMDVDAYLREARRARKWWWGLASLSGRAPYVANRIAALYSAGLFGEERGVVGPPPGAPAPGAMLPVAAPGTPARPS